MSPERPRRLYLVRHAIAAERGPGWPDDSQRPLTPRGTARMRLVVDGIARMGVVIDTVLTSPLVRAVETAQLLVEGLEPAPRLTTTELLAPGQSRRAVIRMLAEQPSTSTLALVGHEPDLGELAASLIGAPEPLEFKKGGVCCIEARGFPPDGLGRLIWHAVPRMLRAVAEHE